MAGWAAVRLRGLKAAPQLNDKLALCKGFDEEKGRWLLELESGEEKAVKNDNILQTLEPGTTMFLERGCLAHVTVGRAAMLTQMEEDARASLDADLATFCERFELRTELNVVEGWPQFSVLVRGVPEQVESALEELAKLLGYYGFSFEPPKKKKPGGAAAAAAEEPEDPETVEVEGMEVKSMERREPRRVMKDRYGRTR